MPRRISTDAAAHQYLVAGAADAHQVEALSAHRLGLVHYLVHHVEDDLGQHGVVTVDRDVDLLGVQCPHVGERPVVLRRTEQDIADIGGQVHTREVGHAHLDAQEDEGHRVGVHANVGPVQRLHHVGVDVGGEHAQLFELVYPLGGYEAGHPLERRAVLSRELLEHGVRDLARQDEIVLTLDVDPDLGGHSPQLLGVLDAVGRRLSLGHVLEDVGYVTTMVRMGGAASADHPDDVPGHDGVSLRAAYPLLGPVAVYGDLARSHEAIPAAYAQVAEAALGLHRLVPVP
jgi:hypothetical protein